MSENNATTALELTEVELDRLENLLDSDLFGGESLLLDEIQALLCAIASGPEVLAPEVWLPEVLGKAPAWESPEQEADARALLIHLYDDVARNLASGAGVAPILYPLEEDSDDLDFAAWADAYLYGTELSDPDWFEAAGEHQDDLSDLLQPLFLLSGAIKEEAEKRGERWLSPTEESTAMLEAQESLPETIVNLYNFWRIKSQPVKTIRRDVPKVGRNDPCPCGSGKKYKQCCGADA